MAITVAQMPDPSTPGTSSVRDALLARATYYDDPASYVAGVEAALEAVEQPAR